VMAVVRDGSFLGVVAAREEQAVRAREHLARGAQWIGARPNPFSQSTELRFRLAAAAEVPVVPLVAEPLTAVADTRRHRTRPGTLRIRVLEPARVDDTSPAGVAEAAAGTRRRMQEALDGLRSSAPLPV